MIVMDMYHLWTISEDDTKVYVADDNNEPVVLDVSEPSRTPKVALGLL